MLLSLNVTAHALSDEQLFKDLEDAKEAIKSIPKIERGAPLPPPDITFDGGKDADRKALERYNRAIDLENNRRILERLDREGN